MGKVSLTEIALMPKRPGRKSGNRFKRAWTRDDFIAKIREWVEEHGEPPRMSDWNPARMRMFMDAGAARSGDWAHRIAIYMSGDWPSESSIRAEFGTWAAAIEEAGFTPRAQGQHTPRGIMPTPRLLALGHLLGDIYDASNADDTDRLGTLLRELAETALAIADDL